jgi:hypothetical protein
MRHGYDKDFMNESIIVVASKKPIQWLGVYDIQRFKEKLMEIPLNRRRVVPALLHIAQVARPLFYKSLRPNSSAIFLRSKYICARSKL